MNNLQNELLQLKINGYCLDYPNDLDTDGLIEYIKSVQSNIIDFCEDEKIGKLKSNSWALLSAVNSIFYLILRYLEQSLQNDDFFEDHIAVICVRLGNELYCYKTKNSILFQAIELLALFVRVFGDPLQKKKFENSY